MKLRQSSGYIHVSETRRQNEMVTGECKLCAARPQVGCFDYTTAQRAKAEKHTGGFPWTEILLNILGEILLRCTSWTDLGHGGPPGALRPSSYTKATYMAVNKAPNVQCQGFTAEENPLSALPRVGTTRADAALQCMWESIVKWPGVAQPA